MNCWRRAGSRPARPSASYGGSIKRRARFRLSQTRLASTERARRSGRWHRSRLAHACSLWTESRSAIWIDGFLSQLTQKSSSRDWFRSPAASLPNEYSAAESRVSDVLRSPRSPPAKFSIAVQIMSRPLTSFELKTRSERRPGRRFGPWGAQGGYAVTESLNGRTFGAFRRTANSHPPAAARCVGEAGPVLAGCRRTGQRSSSL